MSFSNSAVRVIDPMTVDPMYGPPPFDRDGLAVIRRVVSRPKDGATNLDIGYNIYQKGMKIEARYAYRMDEFCLVPNGRVALESDDGTTIQTEGDLMWRPAGASSNSLLTLEDSVTICCFTPARIDATSHRLTPQEIGNWPAGSQTPPSLRFLKTETAPPVGEDGRLVGQGFVAREVVSNRRDGSDVSVIYITFDEGGSITAGSGPGEEIFWVSEGTLEVRSGGTTQIASPRNFIYRPDGAEIDSIRATSPAKLFCFSGPARL